MYFVSGRSVMRVALHLEESPHARGVPEQVAEIKGFHPAHITVLKGTVVVSDKNFVKKVTVKEGILKTGDLKLDLGFEEALSICQDAEGQIFTLTKRDTQEMKKPGYLKEEN